MKIVIESVNNAYMIRNDGKAYGVTQHLYANPEDIEETLFAAEWLFHHTAHSETKKMVLQLASWWLSEYDLEEALEYVDSLPYKVLTKEFITQNWDTMKECTVKEPYPVCDVICAELNQEFLRARYGGMYNSVSGAKDLYFRVSSSGFNWYDIIWDMAYKYKGIADTVTIVRDEESTGVVDGYYKSRSGTYYNKMPIDEFIAENGNPVIENMSMVVSKEAYKSDLTRRVYEKLSKGSSLYALYSLPANKTRIAEKVIRIVYDENKLTRKEQK